ncbi:MAG TPA: MATE family efflux transporter [Candidatus Ventrimonas merdavium]|nr:MATE family efflux transporter [Candidatus Ventrimonas merdavium]
MKLENNLDTDQIGSLVWRLAIPSMLAQFVSVLYSIVDRMYIGNIPQIGEAALAGVGVCGPIVTLVSSFAFLVGVGGAPLMSIRLGEKNKRAARQILANCFLMLLVLSVTLTVIALLLRTKLLWWFGAGEGTFVYAEQYITIYLLGTVFALMTTGMNQFIICQGFAKIGMKSVIIGAVTNIVLDPVFIFVLGLNVRGAAIATVISQIASCAYALRFLFSRRAPIRITFRGYDTHVMRRVVAVGLTPFIIIFLDNVLIISMNTVIQRMGGPGQGDVLLTCTTIVQSFMLMVTMPLGGITSGTQTIMGYNYGAKRPDRIWRAERWVAGLGLFFTTIMFVLAQFFPELFVRLFTQNEEYVRLSVWAIRVSTLGIIPLALQYTVVDGFTGMGISRVALSLSLWRKALYLSGVFLIPRWFGITNVFYTEPLSDFLGTAVSVATFFLLFVRIVGDPRQKREAVL